MLKPSFYRTVFVIDEDSEVTTDTIATKLNVSRATAKRYLRELLKKGYIVETKPGFYKLTEDGIEFKKSILNALNREEGNEFKYIFTDPNTGTPLQLSISSLTQLYVVVKYGIVSQAIVLEHVKKKYLQQWIKDVVGDTDLSKKLDKASTIDDIIYLLEERIKIMNSLKSMRKQ